MIKKILTNFLFNFLFEDYINQEKDNVLNINGQLFIFDKDQGNPNNMKYYFKMDGFWNYIKVKYDFVYDIDKDVIITDCSDNFFTGYNDFTFYKNGVYIATKEEREIYYEKFCENIPDEYKTHNKQGVYIPKLENL